MKQTLTTLLVCLSTIQAFSQRVKEIPPSNLTPGQSINLNIHPWHSPAVPAIDNPFGATATNFQPLSLTPGIKITLGDEGLPIFFEGTPVDGANPVDERTAAAGAIAYLHSIHPAGIQNPATEFVVNKVQADERNGSFYVRLQQHYKGIPVFGAEIIAHTKNGVFASAAGHYAPTPSFQSIAPQISAETAARNAVNHIGTDQMKKEWSAVDLELIGGQQFRSELVVYRVAANHNEPRLAWKIEVYPNLITHLFYFIDANNGAVLRTFNASCNIGGNHKKHKVDQNKCFLDPVICAEDGSAATDLQAPPPPPIIGSGIDLEGINRTFGAWKHTDNKRYLVDAARPMFESAGSTIPNGVMKGVIVTRDQKNIQDGPVSHITSTTDVFNDPNAVSAHYNTFLCYEYYRNTFNRNSINGSGGTINVIVNVPEEGHAMDNAYWSGNSMYWGNGMDYFSPLAKSLDVTGHEMTHGVVQETAGLIYEGESGALNESFADVFAVMIDRDDWAIGDGIMLPGVSETGFLRDFVDPHNGGGDWYQPSHYSEKATGPDDNGGVHANSGITNHAFYLFATNPIVGLDIAEQIYYYTLRDRLTASSKFIDLRLGIIAEAREYYNDDIANAAAAAFDQVGIINGTTHLAAPPLAPGTGKDYIISVSTDEQYLDIYGPDGTFLTTIYEEGVLNRPSVSDNGEQIVFVNFAHQIVGIEIAYNDGSIQYNAGIVSQDSTWRNAAISKDGRFLAGLTTLNDNKVVFFDLADPNGPTPREYFLVNPTNVQGVAWIDNVEYADVIEFDYSGTQLIYDAYSNVENADGTDISHWDIGLLKFWKNGAFAPNDAPDIRKLVSELPQGVGVADPAFSKNSADLIAYDYYIDLPTGGTRYLTYVANVETGNNGQVVSNGTQLGYPCFTTKDDKILFQDKSLIGGYNQRIQNLKPNQVEPQGNPGNIILAHKWGTWLNNGSRVLTVSTTDVTQKALQFSLSPNPNSGFAQIKLSAKQAVTAQLTVMNLLGQTVLQGFQNLVEGENEFDINLKALPAGTYVVRIVADQTQGAVKVVKQ